MTIGWHFDNTYSKLSDNFKEIIKPTPVKDPELIILNEKLAEELNLNFSNISKFYNCPSLCGSSIWPFYYAGRWKSYPIR